MNQLNRKLAPEIESVYIIASPDYSFLSSTGVKEMATFGGDVSDLVPPPVAEALVERLRRYGGGLRARAGACNSAPKIRLCARVSAAPRKLSRFSWTFWCSSTSSMT